MKDFLSTAARGVRESLRRLFRPAFPIAQSRTGLLLETLRRPADKNCTTLTQSLYSRPTLDCERQISILTRRPIADVRALLARSRLHNVSFERRRSSVGSVRRVRRYCESIRIPQRQQYLDLIHEDGRSRIVASFHLGDFLYGPASLFSLDGRARRKFVLSLNRSAGATYENLTAGFGPEAPSPESELLLRRCNSSQLSQLLRAGNTSLFLFCDAPPGLNESTEVRFLNRPAWFSIGPALLALANRVPLLPLLNYYDGKSRQVILGRQVEPLLLGSETLREGAGRVTQDLVTFFEGCFLEYPEQWRFIPLLPIYFSKPAQS